MLQPFLDYAFGFRRGVNAGNHPTTPDRGRIPVPVQRDTPTGRAVAALINRRRMAAATAAVLATLLAAATILLVRHEWLRPTTVTAYFATATSIYPGDDVRVAGVRVGRVTAIQPDGPKVKLSLSIASTCGSRRESCHWSRPNLVRN